MKKIFILLFSLFIIVVKSQSYTWTNADLDNDYENPNNWNPTPLFGFPSFGETAVFDGSVSNDACIIPNDLDVTTIQMMSNYTGTVDASAIDLTIVNMSESGGTFVAPTNSMHITGNFFKAAGAAFVTVTTSVLEYVLTSTSLRTINGSLNLGTIVVSTTGSGNRSINFGSATSTCTSLFFNGGANTMAYRGTINVTSNLTISGSATSAANNNNGTIAFIGAASKTITGTGSALQNPIANISFNTTGTVNMTGNITIDRTSNTGALLGGTWNVSSVGGFNAGTSTVTMRGGTVSAGSTSTSQAFFDNLAVFTGSTTVFSGSSFINLKGDLIHDGTITQNTSLIRMSGSGAQAISGTASLTTLNALEINNSGTKTLGHAVNILDSVRVAIGTLSTGGNLTLVSTSALKGRISEISGGGSISGNVTVQTFAPGGTTDWSVLGASGVSGLSVASWEGQIPMSCYSCPNDENSGGGFFVSIQSWDETQAAGSPSAYVGMSYGNALTVGQGYWVFLGTGLGTTSDINYSVTGPAVQGNVSIPLSNSGVANGDGYNLISNPYASPIRWTSLRNGNTSVDNAIYIYNADLGVTTSFVNGVSSHGVGGANDIIPMGQGFYVRANAATNLTAQETNKVSFNTSANPLLKSANNTIGQVVRLNVSGFDGSYDETAIRLNSNTSDYFDKEWDAYKIYDSPGYIGFPGSWSKRTCIASQLNGDDYSINSFSSPINQDKVIPVIVRVYSSGQYTISPEGIENLDPEACLTLRDKVTNTEHDLKSGSYVCNINDTTVAARFELKICASSSAPVGVKEVQESNGVMNVYQNETGAVVKLDFAKPTHATVSVTNVLGQKVISDKKIFNTRETVHLNLDSNYEVLFITVTTDSGRMTKKIIR